MTKNQKKWVDYFQQTDGARIKKYFAESHGIVIPAYSMINKNTVDFLIKELKLVCKLHSTGVDLYLKETDKDKY